MQIRTALQHYWATAVETLGIIEKSSFKTGEGGNDFKRFFKLASALFSYDEKQPILDELANTDIRQIANELLVLENKLQIFTKLQGLIVTGKHISGMKTKGGYYYLMRLDTSTDTPRVSLTSFAKEQLGIAELSYRLQEVDNVDKPYIELVLISAKDFKDVKKAYPNYFLDAQNFIDNLKRIIKNVSADSLN